jgi:hypothetical protein
LADQAIHRSGGGVYLRGAGGISERHGSVDVPGVAIATTMYREMDMRFWLEQVEVRRPESRGATAFRRPQSFHPLIPW